MSFLNPKPDNPVSKYIEWKSDDKHFAYYDKVTEKNVAIQLPIKFIVFDEFSTIKGFNPHSECGLYSNEVHDLSKEILNVKAFKNPLLISGLYKDIKDRVSKEGGKFTKSVYGVLFNKESYEVVNFQFRGAALGTWIEKKFNTDNFSVVCEKTQDGKVGKIEFTSPIFEKGFELTKEIRERLIPVATNLMKYLESRKQETIESEINNEIPVENETPVNTEPEYAGADTPEPKETDEDLPF